MAHRSWLAAALTGLLALAATSGARADVSAQDRAAAQALFDQGKDLMKGNNIAAACTKFEESQRLDPRIATQFKLADCLEKQGRTASAWTNFLDVAASTKAAGQKDREAVARQRAEALEKKLSRLTIEVAKEPAGLTVLRDGVAVGAAIFGTPTPIDPGEHTIEARAPGKKPWQATVTVKPSGDQARVKIPELEDAPAPAEGPPTGPTATTTAATSAPTGPVSGPISGPGPAPDTASDGSTQRALGWALGGVGVAAGVVGGVFGGLAMNANDSSKKLCRTPDLCSQEGLNLNQEAKDRALVSTVMFAAGGAALAAGVIVLVTAPSKKKASGAALRPVPFFSPDGGGATVVLSW